MKEINGKFKHRFEKEYFKIGIWEKFVKREELIVHFKETICFGDG